MKRRRLNVLYVPEFAMELCVANRTAQLDDQLYLLGEHMIDLLARLSISYSTVSTLEEVVTALDL